MEVVTVLVLLPRYYNPDASGARQPVEDEKFVDSAVEVAEAFEGGGTIFKFDRDDQVRGVWWSKGVVYTDVLAMLEIDVPDTEGNRGWFLEWASGVLMDRFEQEAIYVKFIGGTAAVATWVVTKQGSERA